MRRFDNLHKLSEKAVRNLAEKGANIQMKVMGITPEINQENIIKAAKGSLKVVNSPIGYKYGIVRFRADLITGLEKELAKLKESGKSNDDVFHLYWDIQEFRDLWFRLELNEDNFKALLK